MKGTTLGLGDRGYDAIPIRSTLVRLPDEQLQAQFSGNLLVSFCISILWEERETVPSSHTSTSQLSKRTFLSTASRPVEEESVMSFLEFAVIEFISEFLNCVGSLWCRYALMGVGASVG